MNTFLLKIFLLSAGFLLTISGFTQTFDINFPATNGTVNTVLLHGKTLYVGGSFTKIGDFTCSNLAAIDINTGAIANWKPLVNKPVLDIAAENGVVYFCGNFTTVNNVGRNALAAVDSASGIVTNFNPNIVFPAIPGQQTGSVFSLCIKNQLLYIGGYFISVSGQNRPNVAAIDVTSGLATQFHPVLDIPISVIEVIGNQLYMGGQFYTVNGLSRKGFAAVNLSDGELTNWDPKGDNPGNAQDAILGYGDKIYIAGSFFKLDGISRPYLAQTDKASGAVTSWDAMIPFNNFTPDVNALALSGNRLIVGGEYFGIGGQNRSNLAILDALSGLATLWDPAPDGAVNTLAANDTMIVVGGAFSQIDGETQKGLAVFKIEQPVIVDPGPTAFGIHCYPTPAQNNFIIEPQNGVLIKSVIVISADGKEITVPAQQNSERIILNTSQLSAGTYLVNIIDYSGKKTAVKMLVQ